MLCASRAGARARVRAKEAGRSKLKRGTMPSCQRSVRPPTILPPVLRTSQRPRAAFSNFFQKLRDWTPSGLEKRGRGEGCTQAASCASPEIAQDAPTLRYVREEGLGRTRRPPPRGRAHKPPWGAARESLRFLPRAYQSLGRGKERDYQAEFVFCEKHF